MQKTLFFALAILLSCSACEKKAEGQTVAVVDGEEITSSELNAELAHANLPANGDRKQAMARIVQGLVDRRLLAAQARKDGVDRSPEYISRERRMEQDLLIGMLANRQMNASKLPTDAELTEFQTKQSQAFSQREVWKLSQVQFATPRDNAVSKEIAGSQTLDQMVTSLSRNNIPFQRGDNQLVTSVIPSAIYAQLNALKPGEPFIVPNGERSVASVITARDPSPLTGAAARTEALKLMRQQNSTQMLQQRLKDLRSSAKITYKTGFGPTP